MANNSVSVTFSAQIGQLISGVDQVKSAISSIAGPVNELAGLFTGFGEAFAGAFAVEQIQQFISQMEDLGTQTLRTSAMLGVSTTEAQELGFIAKATGGSADGLALSMERLQLNLAHAQSGIGPAAEALQALGLSAKSLIGLPLDEQMNRIADSLSHFADGGNKTAIVLALLGRSGAEMIPVLDKGRAGLDELRQSAENAGAIVSQQTVIALDKAGTAAVALRASMTALGEFIVGAFANSLIEASNELTTFIGDMSAMVQTNRLGEAAMATLGAAVRETAANFASLATVAADVLSLEWNKVASDWKAGNDEILRIQQETDAKLIAMGTAAKAQLQGILAAPQTSAKPQAPALPVPNTASINAAMSAAQEQIKLADEVYQQQAERLSAEVKLHQITYTQETQALLAALDVRKSAELAAVAKEAGTGNLSVAQAQRTANQKLQIDQKYAQDRQKVLDQAVQEEAKQWQSVLQPIESAWNSQLRSLLAGTETFGQAFKKILGDLLISFIEWCEKQVAEWAAALKLAMATISATASKVNNLPAIQGDVGQAFAGFAAFLAPLQGPAAIPEALGLATAMGATATGLASADVGGHVLSDGLAMIHANETIIPAARIDQPYQGGSAGGGLTVNMGSPLVGTTAFLNQIMPTLSRVLSNYQQLNPSAA